MSKKKNTLKRERTAFEWAILGVSLAAIAAIVAGLLISSISYETGPADLSAVLKPEGRGPNRFVLTVTNRGGATAEDVHVNVSRESEAVEVEFRAVPKGDEEEAVVEIGGSGKPTARVQSYQDP